MNISKPSQLFLIVDGFCILFYRPGENVSFAKRVDGNIAVSHPQNAEMLHSGPGGRWGRNFALFSICGFIAGAEWRQAASAALPLYRV